MTNLEFQHVFGHEFTEDCPSCRWEAGFRIIIKRQVIKDILEDIKHENN